MFRIVVVVVVVVTVVVEVDDVVVLDEVVVVVIVVVLVVVVVVADVVEVDVVTVVVVPPLLGHFAESVLPGAEIITLPEHDNVQLPTEPTSIWLRLQVCLAPSTYTIIDPDGIAWLPIFLMLSSLGATFSITARMA